MAHFRPPPRLITAACFSSVVLPRRRHSVLSARRDAGTPNLALPPLMLDLGDGREGDIRDGVFQLGTMERHRLRSACGLRADAADCATGRLDPTRGSSGRAHRRPPDRGTGREGRHSRDLHERPLAAGILLHCEGEMPSGTDVHPRAADLGMCRGAKARTKVRVHDGTGGPLRSGDGAGRE